MTGVNIGLLIQTKREELKLTQKEIGDAVGVSEATVSRWESGKIGNMRRDRIANLAKILEISPLVLMGMTKTESFVLTANEKELITDYRKLSKRLQTQVYDYIRFLMQQNNIKGE